MRDRKRQQSGAGSLPRSPRSQDSVARHGQPAGEPAARAQDRCVFDTTSRFMNVFVANLYL
jgi:hypothetical protein